jgi:integrating conjugative element protein (TIGR03755 family)
MIKHFCLLVFLYVLVSTSYLVSPLAHAELIPTGDSSFYYQMGGGQPIPVPAYNGAASVPLHVDGDVGLGYDCGVFNPKLTIINSINGIKNGFQSLEQQALNNAKGAVMELPMYAIARADPSLYDLLNNALMGAREDLTASTKSCQTMQNQIAQGQNPYIDWATLSAGNDWQYHMNLASLATASAAGDSDNNNADINQVSAQVAQDNGTTGVPWVQGINTGKNGLYAGGQGQPPIKVIYDTSVAGYNVALQSNRNYDDTSAPAKTDANAHLVNTWANPTLAAQWITNVLGDEIITTYNSGNKQSSPGVGLLPSNQTLTQTVMQNLQNLVSGQSQLTLENLKAVSAPGVMINNSVIAAIKTKSPVTQAILIQKLSQEVATAKIIDEALLAKQLLEEGSQVPPIYSNKPAQKAIDDAIRRLDQAINNFLFNVNVRKQLVSDTVSQLLENTQVQAIQHSTVQASSPPATPLSQGALPSKD